jgi:cytidyltransferase-like protein
MKDIVVTGSFDDISSGQVRFLHEASNLGRVHVLLWSDEAANTLGRNSPKFPLAERLYYLEAIRYTSQVTVIQNHLERDTLPIMGDGKQVTWVVDEFDANRDKELFCASYGLGYHVIKNGNLQGWPAWNLNDQKKSSGRKKVIVTGCFDWLHSGHVRFFEEVSQLGDLYCVVGHDDNIQLLKGKGHPLFSQDERCYMVQSIRFVKQALISTGHGWMDAEPEIERMKPDIYAVNEDGDKPEKREFCRVRGLEYVVLKRIPKEGLPQRVSTILRGF